MAESKRYRVRVDAEIEDILDDAVTSLGYDNQSEALRELARAGYHERKHPAIYRLKDIGVIGAFIYLLLALSTVPFGYLTTAITPTQTWGLSASFVVLGVFWLSVVEGIRYAARWF